MPMTATQPEGENALQALRQENAWLKEELARLTAEPDSYAATIAKLRETEANLRQRERDLQSVLDNMPSMIGYWDRDLRNRFANHAYRIWFGIEPSTMPGMHIREVIGEERYRLNLPYIEAALKGVPQQFERAIPTPDGTRIRHSLAQYIPDIIDGQVAGFFVLVSDISAVKEAEARYDELVRCISVGVYTARAHADGSMAFDYVSPRFCVLLDVDAQAVLADAAIPYNRVHPDYRQSLLDANQHALTTLEPFRWEGCFVVHGKSRWFLIESTATPLPDGDSVWNGVVTDITERKTLEIALQVSNTDLKQFAYVASHDLQSPLRNIVSYLQLLERRYADKLDQDAQEFIGFAVKGAKQMTALINDLLEYSRVDSGEFVPVAMDEVVAGSLERLERSLAETGSQVVVAGPLPVVLGDEIQLGQLVHNLVENAVKYRASDRAAVVTISVERTGPMWTFAIADNGIGIEPEFFERIFNIFQRLHTAEYPGTGIGLALCKRVAERHGGRIWVESRPGEGCTFKFTLPVD